MRGQEIRQRCEKATAGPWVAVIGAHNNTGEESAVVTTQERAVVGSCPVFKVADCGPNDEPSRNDAQFIAHSKEDIPYLLSQLDKERERLEGLVKAAEKIAEVDDEGTYDLSPETFVVVTIGNRSTNYSLTLGDLRALRAAVKAAREE